MTTHSSGTTEPARKHIVQNSFCLERLHHAVMLSLQTCVTLQAQQADVGRRGDHRRHGAAQHNLQGILPHLLHSLTLPLHFCSLPRANLLLPKSGEPVLWHRKVQPVLARFWQQVQRLHQPSIFHLMPLCGCGFEQSSTAGQQGIHDLQNLACWHKVLGVSNGFDVIRVQEDVTAAGAEVEREVLCIRIVQVPTLEGLGRLRKEIMERSSENNLH